MALSALFALILVFGGKDFQFQTWQLPILQLSTVLILYHSIKIYRIDTLEKLQFVRIICVPALLVILVAIQLVPLPMAWVSKTQPQLLGEIRAFGDPAGWVPLTTDMLQTVHFLLYAIMGAALYIAFRLESRSAIVIALRCLLCIAFFSLALAAVQVSTGGRTFDFWNSPHAPYGPGIFANRNHQALFFGLTIAAIWWMAGQAAFFHRWLAITFTLMLLIGVISTGSRAGMILALLLTVGSILIFDEKAWSSSRRFKASLLLGGSAILAWLAFANLRVGHSLSRFNAIEDDLRWTFWRGTWKAVEAFFPGGSGYGTFVDAYALYETIDDVSPTYANRAHNEYLEFLLEGGLLFLVALAGALTLLILRTYRLFRRRGVASSTRLHLLGALWTAAILLHSLVDYPARTPAILTLFALGLAVFFTDDDVDCAKGGRKA
jgi:O-antigen ligase